MVLVKRKAKTKSNAFSSPWSRKEILLLRKNLLAWFDKNQRDLPWRRTQDPYAIALSEIMLQQTQVKTVIPYYQYWLKAFPTWQALAAAPLEKVLKTWEGLGYYQRARNFKAAAHWIMTHNQGQLPNDFELLQQLPGFGRYTAGAVASIAFGKAVPVVDGNVARVLVRLLDCHDPIDTKATHEKLWFYATLAVPQLRSGDFNQALMELGATLCTKGKPACLLCPLASLCRTKTPEILPKKKGKMQITFLQEKVALSLKEKSVWMIQSQNQKRWQDLWHFPAITQVKGKPWKIIEYTITRYRVILQAYFTSSVVKTGRWVKFIELPHLPMPAPHRKLADALLNEFSHETILVSKTRT